jgi:hypothetical protein
MSVTASVTWAGMRAGPIGFARIAGHNFDGPVAKADPIASA